MTVANDADRAASSKQEASSSAATLFVIYVVLNILDLLLTLPILNRFGSENERNPIARKAYKRFGAKGLVGLKIFSVLATLRSVRNGKCLSLKAGIFVHIVVVTNNAIVGLLLCILSLLGWNNE